MEVKINRINFKKAGCIFITIALMVLIASAVFIFVNFHAQIYDYMNGKTADSYILDSHGPVGEHHDHDKEEFFYIGMNTAQKIGIFSLYSCKCISYIIENCYVSEQILYSFSIFFVKIA